MSVQRSSNSVLRYFYNYSPPLICSIRKQIFRPLMSTPTSASISSTTKANSAYRPKRPRTFAPLDPNRVDIAQDEVREELPKLMGIVFDVDGTLCLPQNYMFREMRAALDIPKSVDILDHIQSLSDEPDDHSTDQPKSPRARGEATIQAIERKAMTSQRPQPGLQELISYLSRRSVKKALCTRNFQMPVQHLLDTFLSGEQFEPIITRETEGIAPKPSPEGIWKIAESWGIHLDLNADIQEQLNRDARVKRKESTNSIDPLELARTHLGSGLIMVGDSVDDMAAGYRAGAATVLLVNDENQDLAHHEYTDLAIRSLDELVDVLETGFKGKE